MTATAEILHRGSLMTTKGADGAEQCVGYIFVFEGHGAYSPDGWVEVSAEEVEAHNRALSEAEIKGLDENCQVGQYGVFYVDEKKCQVKTWPGTLVSDRVRIAGRVVTFRRNGSVFRGRVCDGGMLRFRRIE